MAGTSTSLPDAASINICKVNYCGEADSVAVVSGVGLIAAATPGGLATWSVSALLMRHASSTLALWCLCCWSLCRRHAGRTGHLVGECFADAPHFTALPVFCSAPAGLVQWP